MFWITPTAQKLCWDDFTTKRSRIT